MNENDTLSRAESAQILMKMMSKTNDLDEVRALQMAVRNILKRHGDRCRHWVRKHSQTAEEVTGDEQV